MERMEMIRSLVVTTTMSWKEGAETTPFMAEEAMTRLKEGRVETFSKATVEMTHSLVAAPMIEPCSMAIEVTTHSLIPTPQEP